MQKLFINDLPEDFHSRTVIKSSELNQKKRLNSSLELAFNISQHIFSNAEEEIEMLKIKSQSDGFRLGLELIASEFVKFITHYESLQNKRMASYEEAIKTSVSSSFIDPTISEIIIRNITNSCDDLSKVTLVLPNGTVLPEDYKLIPHTHHEGLNFALLHQSSAIKFPSEELMKCWLENADVNTVEMDKTILQAVPQFLQELNFSMADNFNHPLENEED